MVKFKKYLVTIGMLAPLFCLPLVTWAKDDQDKLSPKLQARLLTTKAQETVPLFIYFRDKGVNIEEKLLAAKKTLSPKSLQRRLTNLGTDNLVNFNDIAIEQKYFEQIKSQVTKIRHQLKNLNAVSVEATPAAISHLSKLDFVKRIEIVNKLKRSPAPEVTAVEIKSFKQQLNKQNSQALALDYGNSLTQNNQINVPAVHEMGYSGSGVVVAVFDSGFNRLTHESFAQMNIAGTWDFVNNDIDVGDAADMGEGSHGTSTLSTIGGFSSGKLIGPAYGATYYLAKTENTESELHVEEDNWCAAADWADANGAQIITSSLGYTDFDSGTDYTSADMDGNTAVVTLCADLAAEKGILVINSAGNSGPGKTTIGAPADGHLVVAVGAVTSSGSLSSFSSQGPSADGRIKPDVMAMGTSVFVAGSGSDLAYGNSNGTSFSCPLSAGVAALIIEANPNLTAEQVRDILRNSGDKTAKPNNSFGYGLLDALAAVNAAIQASAGGFAPNASFAVLSNGSTSVDFTNTSTDSDGNIATNSWTFGDGNTSTVESPSHTYASTGTYTVTLTVTDNDGLSEAISQDIVLAAATSPPVTEPSRSSGGGSLGFVFILSLLLLNLRKTIRGLTNF